MKVFIILAVAVAALVGRVACDDKTTISLPATAKVRGCTDLKPRTASVSLQAFSVNGVGYTRVNVPYRRMRYLDVEETSLTAASFLDCADTAEKEGYEVFSYVNDVCKGYTVEEGICPCTTGDFVIYRTENAIRDPSSIMVSSVSNQWPDDSPLPENYMRKIIYPSVSMTGKRFSTATGDCMSFLAGAASYPRVMIMHDLEGKCYYAYAYFGGDCNSCGGPAVEVVVYTDVGSPTFLIPHCNATLTAVVYDFMAPTPDVNHIISHEGYGCIPYPDPPTDEDCYVTVEKDASRDAAWFTVYLGDLDLDTSGDGVECAGDELYVYKNEISATQNCTRTNVDLADHGDRLIIVFQRRPAVGPGSKNDGFAMSVFSDNVFADSLKLNIV